MAEPTPITREQLLLSLRFKVHAAGVIDGAFSQVDPGEAAVARMIKQHQLECVIAGRHLNKPITFEAAFKQVFGAQLSKQKCKA